MGCDRVGCGIWLVLVVSMPGPKPPEIVLSDEERAELERLVRAYTTPQHLVLRARIVLLAADGLSTSQIARTLGVEIGTPRKWRARWWQYRAVPLDEVSTAVRLADAPKPGAPARITPEQVCQIVALACETPDASGRPISTWSQRELADEVVKRGIMDRISPRHVRRLLKSRRRAAAPRAVLAHPGRGRAP